MYTFVFTDIHGNKILFDKIYSYFKKLSYEWKCIFLGDACDRGQYGYEIMKTLLTDGHFIYLKGDYEDMFVKAARGIFRTCWDTGIGWPPRRQEHDVITLSSSQDEYVALSVQNGGFPTLLAWLKDGGNMNFVNKIAKLPLKYSEGRFDFCHSGTTKEKWLQNKDDKDFIWDESHYSESWFDGRTLVFGHRTVDELRKLYIKRDIEGSCRVAEVLSFESNNRKIDLNIGYSDRIIVLNLNDMSSRVFCENKY